MGPIKPDIVTVTMLALLVAAFHPNLTQLDATSLTLSRLQALTKRSSPSAPISSPSTSSSSSSSSSSTSPVSSLSEAAPTAPLTQKHDILVQTSSGRLRGKQQSVSFLGHNQTVYKFLSVRYAKAPINGLRFMAPVELDEAGNETSVVEAIELGPTCPQFRHLVQFISPLMNVDHEHRISEDCLRLNIYVPAEAVRVSTTEGRLEPARRKPLPVIVWIPGEGFDFADARQFDGSALALKTQAIVVSVQYRVGVLGFLNWPEKGAKGNAGLLDQLMALKWLRKNVDLFGGDPDNVTLMGRFTGSMAISSLITAPKQDLIRSPSDGKLLFRRVALLSGVTVDSWIVDPRQHERAPRLALQAVGRELCQTYDLGCLQSLPVDELVQMADYAWRPTVDHELIGDLTPAEAIKANRLSPDIEAVLIGETASEGSLCLMRHLLTAGTNNNFAQVIEENRMTARDLYEMIRDDAKFYFKYSLTGTNPVQRAIESMAGSALERQLTEGGGSASPSEIESDTNNQINRASIASKLRDRYFEACSSYLIKFHTNEFKKNLVAQNNLAETRLDLDRKPVKMYHYELRYKPSFSLAPKYIKSAAHGDDVSLIFGLVYNQHPSEIDEGDLEMTLKMMQLVGEFANGNEPRLEGMSSDTSNQSVPRRRSWSGESQLVTIDYTPNEIDDKAANKASLIARRRQSRAKSSPVDQQDQFNLIHGDEKSTNIRVILIEEPASADHPRSKSNLDPEAAAARQQVNQEWNQLPRQDDDDKSHRAVKIRRIDDSSSAYTWPQLDLSRQPNGQPQPKVVRHQEAMVSEGAPVIVLLMSCSIVLLSVISLALATAIFRLKHNSAQDKQTRHRLVKSSMVATSSCNFCDADSRGNSVDADLDDCNRKEGGAFSNVFAKLRNHNQSVSATQMAESQGSSAPNSDHNQNQHSHNHSHHMQHQAPENSTDSSTLKTSTHH